jgi:zinc protease
LRTKVIAWTLSILFCLLATSAAAEFKLDVQEYTLDNGLTILMVENHSAPVMTYFTMYKVGTRNERVDNSGISHFFEHMMFNGAAKYGPKMFDKTLESNGGYSNAFTSKDYTGYFEDFSSDILELVMDLESDRMLSLALDSAMVVSERGVVSEERLVSTDNNNEDLVSEELYATAYESHPYRGPVLGWMESIRNFNRKDCVEYFKTYYAPNNAVVVMVGDFDSKQALDLMKKYFGKIPAGPPPPSVPRYETEQRGEKREIIRKETQYSHFTRGYHVGDKDSPDLFALDVVQFILTSGESSRMYQTLVDDLQVALWTYGGFSWGFDPQLFYFYVAAVPGKEYTEVERAFDSVLTAFIAGGPTEAELTRAKNSLTASFYKGFKTNNGTAEQIATYKTLWGDYRKMYDYVTRINSVTAEQVKEAAAKYFTVKNSTTIVLVPEGGGQ